MISSYSTTTGRIGYTVPRDGVYAVIFNPIPYQAPALDSCDQSLICTYRWFIIAALIIVFGVILPASYIFWRLYRYVMKYRESKDKMKKMQNVYDEVMNTTTDTPFQSVKDKLEGIVFRKNPLLKKDEPENEEISLLKSAVEKLDKERKEIDKDRRELLDKHNYYSREIMKLRTELERLNSKSKVKADYVDMSVSKEFNWWIIISFN